MLHGEFNGSVDLSLHARRQPQEDPRNRIPSKLGLWTEIHHAPRKSSPDDIFRGGGKRHDFLFLFYPETFDAWEHFNYGGCKCKKKRCALK